MLLNYSNHPSGQWGDAQTEAAHEYGQIEDMAFPAVPADMDEAGLRTLADREASRILDAAPSAVLCQGEMTLAFAVVRRLQAAGVTVLAACSERETVEQTMPDGSSVKKACFRFVRFRYYDG